MSKKFFWVYYYFKSAFWCFGHRIFDRHTYFGNKLMLREESNKWIRDRIEKGIPTAIVRFGAIELNILRKVEYKKIYGKSSKRYSEAKEQFRLNAGFFSNSDEQLKNFIIW